MRAVKILNGLAVLVQSLGSEDFSFQHFRPHRFAENNDALPDLFGRELRITLKLNRTDLVASALVNDEADRHPCGAYGVELHLLEIEVYVALVPVKISELFLVLLKLFLLELAAAGQPGKHPVPPRLDLLPQLPLRKGLRADELHVHNPDLGRLGDLERDRGAPQFGVDAFLGLDLGLAIAGLLVFFFDFLRVGEQLVFIQRLANPGLHLFKQAGVVVFSVSLKPDVPQHRLALQHVNQFDAPVGAIDHYADVQEITRGLKRGDVIVCGRGIVTVACFYVEVGPDKIVADGRRADVVDLDLFDDGARLRRERQPPARRQQCDQKPASA